jgi:hypothetical protein
VNTLIRQISAWFAEAKLIPFLDGQNRTTQWLKRGSNGRRGMDIMFGTRRSCVSDEPADLEGQSKMISYHSAGESR